MRSRLPIGTERGSDPGARALKTIGRQALGGAWGEAGLLLRFRLNPAA